MLRASTNGFVVTNLLLEVLSNFRVKMNQFKLDKWREEAIFIVYDIPISFILLFQSTVASIEVNCILYVTFSLWWPRSVNANGKQIEHNFCHRTEPILKSNFFGDLLTHIQSQKSHQFLFFFCLWLLRDWLAWNDQKANRYLRFYIVESKALIKIYIGSAC